MPRSLAPALVVLVAAALIAAWLFAPSDRTHTSVGDSRGGGRTSSDVELAARRDTSAPIAREAVEPQAPGLVLRWRIDPPNEAVVGLPTTLALYPWLSGEAMCEVVGVFAPDGWAEARLDALPERWDDTVGATVRVESGDLEVVTDHEYSLSGDLHDFWARERWANLVWDANANSLQLVDASRDGEIEFTVPAVVVRPLVAGRVVDELGRGVEGAAISFARIDSPWAARPLAHVASRDGTTPEAGGVVLSATDGSFDVLGAGFEESVHLAVSVDDGRYAHVRDIAVGTHHLEVRLERTARVVGRLMGDAGLLRVIDLALVSHDDGRARPLGIDPRSGAVDVELEARGTHDLVWCVGRELLRLPPIATVDLVAGATTDLGDVVTAGAIRLHAVQVIERAIDGPGDGPQVPSLDRHRVGAALVVLRGGERSRIDDAFWDERIPEDVDHFLSCRRPSMGGWGLVSPHLVTTQRLAVSNRGATMEPAADACWPIGDPLSAPRGVDWVVTGDALMSGLFRRLAFEGAISREDLPLIERGSIDNGLEQHDRRERIVRASRFAAVVGEREAAADPMAFLEQRGFDPLVDDLGDVLLLASDGSKWTGEILSPSARPMAIAGHQPFQVVRREPAAPIGFDMLLPECPEGWRVGVRVLGLDGSDDSIEPCGIAFVPDDRVEGPARIRFATDRTGRFRVLPVAWCADEHPRLWLDAPMQEPEEAARFPFAWEDRAGDPNLVPARVEWPATLVERALAVDVAEGRWPEVEAGSFEELAANDAAYRDVAAYP